MDILTFISQIINSLAWPIAAIIIGVIFRKPLSCVLENIESFSYKGAVAKVRKKTEKLGEEIEKGIPIQEPQPTTEEQQPELERDEFDEIYLKLEESPPLAISLAWSKLEIEALLALKRHQYFQEQGKISINPYSILQGLKEKELLDENQLKLFNRLRQLKNNAVHHMRFPIPEEIALSYIESVKKMFSYLKNI